MSLFWNTTIVLLCKITQKFVLKNIFVLKIFAKKLKKKNVLKILSNFFLALILN